MIVDSKLPVTFWAEAVNTACFVQNRVLITKSCNKTPYEIMYKRKPVIDFFRKFGCVCTMLNTSDQLNKFEAKADECYFVGYSSNQRAFRVYHKKKRIVMESIDINWHENNHTDAGDGPNWLFDVDSSSGSGATSETVEDNSIPIVDVAPQSPVEDPINDIADPPAENLTNLEEVVEEDEIPQLRIHKILLTNNIIGPLNVGVSTRSVCEAFENSMFSCFISQAEPKNIKAALLENSWVEAMQEELQQFAPVARLEAIRMFLAYAAYMDFTVHQMDVKSAFLYSKVQEEVYVKQPPGFIDPNFPDRVYKLDKALYGLHQAPRAWYETLSKHLLKNGFTRGAIDQTLFKRKDEKDTIMVQIYVDDIIFGSTNPRLCKEFEEVMRSKFEMSSMGEMKFFLGLQVDQSESGILIHQEKYVKEILTKFKMADSHPVKTLVEVRHCLTPDVDGESVDQHLYRSMIGSLMYLTASRPDIMFAVCLCARFQANPKLSHLSAVKHSDYGGCNLDRKSTSGGCQFLGNRLVSWQCKKQSTVSQSTAEAEYIAAALCCSQVRWIHHQMLDYGITFHETPILCYNTAVPQITKNPVQHSKTKHNEIKHHFIRDCVEKKHIQIVEVKTNKQTADIFTKTFDSTRFAQLVEMLGMINFQPKAMVFTELLLKWVENESKICKTEYRKRAGGQETIKSMKFEKKHLLATREKVRSCPSRAAKELYHNIQLLTPRHPREWKLMGSAGGESLFSTECFDFQDEFWRDFEAISSKKEKRLKNIKFLAPLKIRGKSTHRQQSTLGFTGVNSPITIPPIANENSWQIPSYIMTAISNTCQFHSRDDEDAPAYIARLTRILGMFQLQGATNDAIFLQIFPFTLADRAATWLDSQPTGTYTTWATLRDGFLKKYFPPAKASRLRDQIHSFRMEPDESYYLAWERFQNLLARFSQHGLSDWALVEKFYNGLNYDTKAHFDTSAG
ncbi:hypothetical protein L1987_10672 [Smallanthus sonchifolius]|uniref:Uncharacterized protein n=1 Tax=Smallanthus sonchifolius TaxID=185202 RepID=A0ACB9J9R7_9ASTR|nr:hypothetical protein L1987_10672 [Smallanthus sonchifolius]